MSVVLFKSFFANFLRKKMFCCARQISQDYDVVVVGGGIIGTAAAREIKLRHPHLKMALLEKEQKLALHQSGHTCGVVHAGIYYKSRETARLCVDGMHLMYRYCDSKGIPYKKCGKLVVATNVTEARRLLELQNLAKINQAPGVELIDRVKIKQIEPYCNGVAALWSPHTGSVDFSLVTEHLGEDFKKAGGDIHLHYKVQKFVESTDIGGYHYPVNIHSQNEDDLVRARYVVTCAGLQADVLAAMTGCPAIPRIVPFRGEYLLLADYKSHMVQGHIYAVPNPRSPALGVHLTPLMNGRILLGPNVVLALAREGYRWSNINVNELYNALSYTGFQKMVWKHLRVGLAELFKSPVFTTHIKELQKYIPNLDKGDILRGPTGVRAQAVDVNGNLLNELIFHRGTGDEEIAKRVLHIRNMHWPGATSCLATAKFIADKIEVEFAIDALQKLESRKVANIRM